MSWTYLTWLPKAGLKSCSLWRNEATERTPPSCDQPCVAVPPCWSCPTVTTTTCWTLRRTACPSCQTLYPQRRPQQPTQSPCGGRPGAPLVRAKESKQWKEGGKDNTCLQANTALSLLDEQHTLHSVKQVGLFAAVLSHDAICSGKERLNLGLMPK